MPVPGSAARLGIREAPRHAGQGVKFGIGHTGGAVAARVAPTAVAAAALSRPCTSRGRDDATSPASRLQAAAARRRREAARMAAPSSRAGGGAECAKSGATVAAIMPLDTPMA